MGAGLVRDALVVLALLLLSSPTFGLTEEGPLDVEEILSGAPDSGDYVESVRCLPTSRIRSVTALDDRHIVFRANRGERYLVQLPRRCPGIRRNETIAYESTSGNSVCRGDGIWGTFGFGPGTRKLGPRCTIPGFQRITPEQVELLRESLRQARAR